MYPTNNGVSASQAAAAQAAGLPIQRIMPDIHIGAW
jgi:carbamoylphosphate synthase large subunit